MNIPPIHGRVEQRILWLQFLTTTTRSAVHPITHAQWVLRTTFLSPTLSAVLYFPKPSQCGTSRKLSPPLILVSKELDPKTDFYPHTCGVSLGMSSHLSKSHFCHFLMEITMCLYCASESVNSSSQILWTRVLHIWQIINTGWVYFCWLCVWVPLIIN